MGNWAHFAGTGKERKRIKAQSTQLRAPSSKKGKKRKGDPAPKRPKKRPAKSTTPLDLPTSSHAGPPPPDVFVGKSGTPSDEPGHAASAAYQFLDPADVDKAIGECFARSSAPKVFKTPTAILAQLLPGKGTLSHIKQYRNVNQNSFVGKFRNESKGLTKSYGRHRQDDSWTQWTTALEYCVSNLWPKHTSETGEARPADTLLANFDQALLKQVL